MEKLLEIREVLGKLDDKIKCKMSGTIIMIFVGIMDTLLLMAPKNRSKLISQRNSVSSMINPILNKFTDFGQFVHHLPSSILKIC